MTRDNRNPFGNDSQRGLWVPSPFSRRQVLAAAGGIAVASALAACGGDEKSPAKAGGKPKRGGNFRVGSTGGGAKDTMDAQTAITNPDVARIYTAFETLVEFDNDAKLQLTGLAESLENDGPSQYTIRLRKGIEFHNGKTLTADDVIYSLQRVANDVNAQGHGQAASMDTANAKKLDEYTVRLPLKSPDSTIPAKLAGFPFSIVPVGYEAFKNDPRSQAGTGAYKLKSFTRGVESKHERNPNYWRGDGSPWFDQVTIINFSDATAQVNALLGGQIDAMSNIPTAQVAAIEAQNQKVLTSQNGNWTALVMAIDMPPFDDNRVRQAFRLLIDRQAMLEQVGSGYGEIGNDVFGIYESTYNHDLPQREQDIDEAKALLKAAGHEGLTVDLNTTEGPATVELATVFAEQAKRAGVTVNVKNVPNDTYFGDDFLKYAFSVDWWSPRGDYLLQAADSMLSTSPYPETHWPPKSGEGSNYEELYNEALATYDEAARTELVHQMQQLDYDLGGYIIPYFPALVDGHAANVRGLVPAKTRWNLNQFGHGFRTLWFE